jgi:Tfp pilus assembly protein PilZ
VNFWVHGEEHPRTAFVHDISTTGVFVSTPYPLPRGTEIRIEIHDQGSTYTVEAVVSRRVWVAPDLRKLGPTGMGARFLAPDELVGRLRERGAGRVAGDKQHEDHFLIVLEDDQQLLRTYTRDLELGGLFIPSEVPPALNREIQIDFQLPGVTEVFACRARVVQRVPAGQDGGALQAGMAVAFDDPGAVLERLRPFLQETAAAQPSPDSASDQRDGASSETLAAGEEGGGSVSSGETFSSST